MNEIFNKLIKEKLTPNSLYVLHCIKEKISISKLVSDSLEINKLKADEWLAEDLSLTRKSVIFIEEINSYFRKSKKKTSSDLMGDNFDTYIKLYKYFIQKVKIISKLL